MSVCSERDALVCVARFVQELAGEAADAGDTGDADHWAGCDLVKVRRPLAGDCGAFYRRSVTGARDVLASLEES